MLSVQVDELLQSRRRQPEVVEEGDEKSGGRRQVDVVYQISGHRFSKAIVGPEKNQGYF